MGDEEQRQGDDRGRDGAGLGSGAGQTDADDEGGDQGDRDGDRNRQTDAQLDVDQAERGVGDALGLLDRGDGQDGERVAGDGPEPDVTEREHAGVADVELDPDDDDRVDQHHGDEPLGGPGPQHRLIELASAHQQSEKNNHTDQRERDVAANVWEESAEHVRPARRGRR